MTRQAPFKRRVRARMSKTGESYVTARAQLDDPERAAAAGGAGGAADPAVAVTSSEAGTETTILLADNVLNITNGDSVSDTLGTPGVHVLPWRDVLHDGPVPAVPAAELRRVRAAHLGRRGYAAQAEALRGLESRDRTVEEFAGRSYVLWFEADLYDQLQIVQVLDRLRGLAVPPERVHLVSIGEFPGIAHFGGLGQLDHRALMRLLRDAVALTQDDLDMAAEAWNAFTAADPSGLPAVSRTRSAALRFLGEGFGRLMQEYPSAADGLSLTERRILLAVEDGAGTAGEVFAEIGRRERRPYLGDWPAYSTMAELAGGGQPLLVVDGGAAPADPAYGAQPVRLTDAGREVLAGRADRVEVNGVDRWVGGVHLAGHTVGWRYDDRRETLVPT